VGPVAAASARARTSWARDILATVRAEPTSTGVPPDEVVDDVAIYVDSRADAADIDADGVFLWRANVPADELVFLTNSLYNLDRCVAAQAERHPGRTEPTEGHGFHAVLGEALLFALTQEGPSEAAFRRTASSLVAGHVRRGRLPLTVHACSPRDPRSRPLASPTASSFSSDEGGAATSPGGPNSPAGGLAGGSTSTHDDPADADRDGRESPGENCDPLPAGARVVVAVVVPAR
jgi:hypothetical protein